MRELADIVEMITTAYLRAREAECAYWVPIYGASRLIQGGDWQTWTLRTVTGDTLSTVRLDITAAQTIIHVDRSDEKDLHP